MSRRPEPTHGALDVTEAPCEHCAVWIGPHRHWLREDGSLGLVVQSLEPGAVSHEARTLVLVIAEALRLDRPLEWLDRQLRRSPRLYRWLSR